MRRYSICNQGRSPAGPLCLVADCALGICSFLILYPLAAFAGGGLVDAGEFSSVTSGADTATSGNSGQSSADATPVSPSSSSSSSSSSFSRQTDTRSNGSVFGLAPLSGQVSVVDHLKGGGTRLKRATIPIDRSSGAQNAVGDGVANSHQLPLGGFLQDSAAKLQSLFPTLDNGPPVTPGPALNGAAQQDQPPTTANAPPNGHPIWQKSPFGGYYDASGNVRDVIKGNQLYRYGGTMADGMTPAPSGPVEQNSMGYIKWQPIHGGPPGWY